MNHSNNDKQNAQMIGTLQTAKDCSPSSIVEEEINYNNDLKLLRAQIYLKNQKRSKKNSQRLEELEKAISRLHLKGYQSPKGKNNKKDNRKKKYVPNSGTDYDESSPLFSPPPFGRPDFLESPPVQMNTSPSVDITDEVDFDLPKVFDNNFRFPSLLTPLVFGDEYNNPYTRETPEVTRGPVFDYGSSHSHLESLVLLTISIFNTKNVQGVVAAVLSYLKIHHVQGGLIMNVQDWLLVNFVPECLDSGYSPQAGIIDTITNLSNGWQEFIKSPAFSYIGKILSICVALGLCSSSSLQWDWGAVQLFSVNALKKQLNAFDIVDAVLTTTHYFLTSAVECISTRSLRPLLFANKRMDDLDKLFYNVQSAMAVYTSGNLAHSPIPDELTLVSSIGKLISELSTLRAMEKDTVIRRILDLRTSRAYEWQSEVAARSMGGQIRVAPYTLLVYGMSGLGKATITTSLITALLCSNGFDHTDPKRVVTVVPDDKFISNAKADTLAYIIDDMGSANPKVVTVDFARRWLDMSNNVASYANKAESQDKGMCTFNHKIQVGTSNLQDGGMNYFSAYPAAVARRGSRDHIQLKPAFMGPTGLIDGPKVSAAFPNEAYPDIYDITVYNAVEDANNPGMYNMIPDIWVRGGTSIPMVKVTYLQWIEFHIERSQAWFVQQQKLVDEKKTAPGRMQICKVHNCLNTICKCAYVPQMGQEIMNYATRLAGGYILRRFRPPMDRAVENMYQHVDNFIRPVLWIPDIIFLNPYLQHIVRDYIASNTLPSYRWGICIWSILFLTLEYFLATSRFGAFIILMGSLLLLFYLRQIALYVSYEVIVGRVMRDRHALRNRVAILRSASVNIIKGGALLLAGITAYRTFMEVKRKFTVQGNLSPTSVADINARDKEVNPWQQVVSKPMPCSDKSKRSCFDHLLSLVKTNQLYMSVEDGGRRPCSDAFVVRSGYIVIPYHMTFDDVRTYIFQRDSISVLGTSFKARFCRKDVILIDGTDLALVYLPSCGDFKDLSDYLALETPATSYVSLVYKTKEGEFNDLRGFEATLNQIECPQLACPSMKALEYTLPYNSFAGLCCGTVMVNGKSPTILGFHSAGVNGTHQGACSLITQFSYNLAEAQLRERYSSCIPLADSANMYTVQHGITYFESPAIHPKSPLNFTDPELITSANVYGSVIGRTKSYSNVVPTSIAANVREVFQRPLKYGPPKFHIGRHWNTHLNKCLSPSVGCSQSLLELAVRDYSTMIPMLINMPGVTDQIRPLSDLEVVNGIDGIRFIDRMKAGASMGFPINKSKKNFLTPCDGPNAVNYTFPSEVWKAYYDTEQIYASGDRAYPVFRACLKDEVKSSDSEKVRVFEAAPIVAQIGIRKYFLPVARMLSMFPLLSECAVGINATSDEWDQLVKYVTQFGTSRIIAGDYSSYDTRMPAQFTIAAFSIIIDIAESSNNYTSRDITIMRNMVTDIVHPLVAFNGDLVLLLGTNPSGQNLTVYINSIVNSLYLRCSFLSVYPQYLFRDQVHLTTYGDDFMGGVSTTCPHFTFAQVRDFLKEMEIKLTLPDKSDSDGDIVYLPFNKVDFLKRRSYFHPELKYEVGLLDEESILRSLVCQVSSSVVTLDEQVVGAITSALHEWFFYGKEVYDDRLAKLGLVLENFPLIVPAMADSYSTMLTRKIERDRGPDYTV